MPNLWLRTKRSKQSEIHRVLHFKVPFVNAYIVRKKRETLRQIDKATRLCLFEDDVYVMMNLPSFMGSLLVPPLIKPHKRGTRRVRNSL